MHVANKLDANHEQIALLDQLRGITLARYAAGAAEKTDALQAEVELAILEHERVVLERDRRVLAARMNALLHRPQGQPIPPPPADLGVADSLSATDVARAREAARWPRSWRPRTPGGTRGRRASTGPRARARPRPR